MVNEVAPAAPRRTQAQRREATRTKLLEGTLECLGQLGYARATTTEIVKAAGVSQGALFRHFPTKAALLAAAVEYLFDGLRADYRREFRQVHGPDRAQRGFELLWKVYTGPRLIVAFELYMAARTDPELAQALHPVVRAHRAELLRLAAEAFPEAANTPRFIGVIDLLMCTMEGVVLERFGGGPEAGEAALRQLQLVALDALKGID